MKENKLKIIGDVADYEFALTITGDKKFSYECAKGLMKNAFRFAGFNRKVFASIASDSTIDNHYHFGFNGINKEEQDYVKEQLLKFFEIKNIGRKENNLRIGIHGSGKYMARHNVFAFGVRIF
jgi:hypothetical protein